jgi:hypothetical protein
MTSANKRLIKDLTKLSRKVLELHESDGVIDISSCGIPSIHFKDESFFKVFDSWERKYHDRTYDRCFVIVGDVEFFCLVDKE